MNRIARTTLALAAGALAGVAQAQEATTTLASFPAGTFLENLDVGPDERLVFTSYFDRTVLAWSGTGAPTPLVVLDGHPVGILSLESGLVLTMHGTPFTAGPSFTATNAFVVTDRDGGAARVVPAPDALFLNGLVELAPGVVLAADSLAGRIWRFDVATGVISEWLADPLLAVDPAVEGFSPGANGLEIADGQLYVSNSSRRALYRVALDGERPAGAPVLFSQTGPIDDFSILADGTIAAASHGETVIAVDRAGAVTTLLAEGCDGCTALVPYGSAGDLVVLTTGSLLEGGTNEARVFSMASPIAR
ncbi:SMP-30/gluconolactonase/LRE family protein [Salinarimonas sp. NSM]|uniref:SMP-30/gluconolactonase/LRE family protein n=1 Tax=Salinarimonas sp. NSM TaxID=3458003 RepID=UPI004036B59A